MKWRQVFYAPGVRLASDTVIVIRDIVTNLIRDGMSLCAELDHETAHDEVEHEPAERDPMGEEAWHRDICNLANTLCPTMVLMFMRAGAQSKSPNTPPRALSAHVTSLRGVILRSLQPAGGPGPCAAPRNRRLGVMRDLSASFG